MVNCHVHVQQKLIDGMDVKLASPRAKEAQTEAMDRILENHLLYCTVCDNNNGNCKVHNTVDIWEWKSKNIHTSRNVHERQQ